MKTFINKHIKLIKYGIGGIMTSLFHMLFFMLLLKIDINYQIANIITLIVVKTLAYFVNKIFVFESKCENKLELTREVIMYILSRLFTMIIDYYLLIIMVEVIHVDVIISKLIVLLVVVFINYLLCNTIVYKKVKK